MFRLLITLTGVLLAVVITLITGARLIGRQTAPPPTYLAPGACAQPCWQGLRPGAVNLADLSARVSATTPYILGHTAAYDGVHVTAFSLFIDEQITLADVIREFGPPERVGCLAYTSTKQYAGLNTAAEVYYAGGLVVVDVVQTGDLLRLTPAMGVRAVSYYAPGEPAYRIGETTPWHGFATVPVYQSCYN